jgi:flagellar hook-associated protein 3 FlgL
LEEQLFTQKRVNRPSDDPVSATRIMDLRKLVAQFDQFDRNISTAEAFVSHTEVALGQVVDRLQRAIELTVDINDGTSGPSEYALAAEEIGDIFKEIVSAANERLGNRYIFGGYETTTVPFDDAGNYLGGPAGQDIEVEIGQGEYMAYNFTGDEVFKGPVDVMQVILDTQAAIASGDQTAISNQLPELEAALDQILRFTTINGARSNRLTSAYEDNIELRDSFIAILSDVEDIDVTAVSSEFAMQEQVLEANRLIASRIMGENFLDFYV